MASIVKDHQDLIAAARDIAQKAKNENRSMTSGEVAEFDHLMGRAGKLETVISQAKASQARFDEVRNLGRPSEDEKGYLNLSAPGLVKSLLTSAADTPHSVKSLIADGASLSDAPLVATAPISAYGVGASILAALPARRITGSRYSYLRQTARDSLAAPVADGDLKPTSTYTLERIEGHLRVIAHLAAPVNHYWLADNSSLKTFVEQELVYGLQLAIEDQVLNGDGTGENMRGLLGVSGAQMQAFSVDAIQTIRRAVGKLEVFGAIPAAVVMNPTDWENIELKTTSTGEYLIESTNATTNLPSDVAPRRLWSVPVTTSVAMPIGKALVVAEGAAEVVTDGRVETTWGVIGDDFSRNLVRARSETRADLAVMRPAGIVIATLAA